MSSSGRMIVGIFSLVVVHTVFSMDQLPVPVDIIHRRSSGNFIVLSGSSGHHSPTLSQSPQQSGWGGYVTAAFNGICDRAANGLKSATDTVTNKVSDEAAFKKLGWPPSDTTAEAELNTCLANYATFKTLTLNFECFQQEYVELEAFINRRRDYLRRAIIAFPTLDKGIDGTEGTGFATHCLKHHICIMHSFEEGRIRAFLGKKQRASKNVDQMISQALERDFSESKAEQDR